MGVAGTFCSKNGAVGGCAGASAGAVSAVLAAACVMSSLGFGAIVINEFARTGLVTHPSTAVLAVAFALVGVVSMATGLILDTVNRRSNEIQRLITDQLVSQRRPSA